MTKDDARKLMSGYATSSLTEAERKALMEAALEDQGLFDELADEVALKEVLDEPGARQRLLAALESPRQRHRAWLFWATAAATLAIVVGVVIVTNKRTPAPQQIAQVLKSPEPIAAPSAPPPPSAEPPQVRRKVAPAPSPKPLVEPPAGPAAEPTAEPTAELRKEESLADRAPLPSPSPPPRQARPQAAGAVRQFAAASVPGEFAFRYAIQPDRSLEIVPAAAGFLAVSANGTVVFPSSAVSVGTPVRVRIPSEATTAVVAFSATPGTGGTPVRRDEPSGTVTDQDPPNNRILIQLFLTPATQ